MRKFLLPLLALSLCVPGNVVKEANAIDGFPSEGVTMENSGDDFYLSQVSYAANESFVYTAVANFEHGQACGLAFGSQSNDHYWVFNIDRNDDVTKLLYFDRANGPVYEVKVDFFIGNDKTTSSEFNVIKPSVAALSEYNFKVVLTIEDEHAWAEFFIDNIKRYGVDEKIDLNQVLADKGISYQGGSLGFNVFNSRTHFGSITFGASDYSYYTELYRNQYHYSQYAHWNNDPNGLVYYDGWYHMFYQTHPFSKFWSDMYWGHARSRDLLHWQELPIALFPDDGTMGKGLGKGLAWSGIAMVYRPGMSTTIDANHWFDNNSGTGLIGYYTRDGEKQDQILISSDDGGMTWVKRELISQHIIYADKKIDCRDPSIFPVKKTGDHVDLWGMVLSGAKTDKYWFLKSTDLVSWTFAGENYLHYPECMTVSKMVASDNKEYSVMTVSSRSYTVGKFVYNEGNGNIEFHLPDGRNINDVHESEAFKQMDYCEDSYAAQCFYIDDDTCDYYGKNISISWASGLPSDAESGAYAEVRHPWNGGGMTIPVELGLTKVGENDYALTQKPITKDNAHLEKTELVNLTDTDVTNESENFLKDVHSQRLEIECSANNYGYSSRIEFRVNVGLDEYTSFGWTRDEGYFLDRSHTSRAGINFQKGYSRRFTTGCTIPTGQYSYNPNFYVLVDNGSLEVFCDDFKYAFYAETLAAPYSLDASLTVSSQFRLYSLKVNEVKSTWKDLDNLEKGVLYVDKDEIELDYTLTPSQEILAYSTNNSPINFEVTTGNDVISLTKTNRGAKVESLKNGFAVIHVTSEDYDHVINVTVKGGEVDCDYPLNPNQIYSGQWLATENGIEAKQNGDGFLISDMVGGNFTYSAQFNLANAQAAGLLLRASKDMSSYVMANYDKNANECKAWSPKGLICSGHVDFGVDVSNVTLTVRTEDRNIEIRLNGVLVTSGTMKIDDPLTGYFGLNIFNGTALFKSVSVLKSEYTYENKDVQIDTGVSQYIFNIYNMTDKNTLVARSYYYMSGDDLVIRKSYFDQLKENTIYSFYVEGSASSFTVKVMVGTIQRELIISDYMIKEGESVNVFMGAFEVESILVNGVALTTSQYEVNGKKLHFDSTVLNIGLNEVSVNGVTFKVTVQSLIGSTSSSSSVHNLSETTAQTNVVRLVVALSSFAILIALGGVSVYKIRRRRGEK